MPLDETISGCRSIYPGFVRGACSLMCVVGLWSMWALRHLLPMVLILFGLSHYTTTPAKERRGGDLILWQVSFATNAGLFDGVSLHRSGTSNRYNALFTKVAKHDASLSIFHKIQFPGCGSHISCLCPWGLRKKWLPSGLNPMTDEHSQPRCHCNSFVAVTS